MQHSGDWLQCSLVSAALLVGACGEVKAPNTPDSGSNVDPNADFTLTVDPSSLTIPIASSAKMTVTVARTGTTGDIALSATGLGANITVDFSPASIPEGSATSEVTIAVKGGTVAGMSTVTLIGTAGAKTHSADVSLTSTTITVNGTVRGARSGVKVGLVGKTSVTSGPGGVFTFTDVTPPYDLYTVGDEATSSGSVPTVYYFDDLTRPDPIVSAAPIPVSIDLSCILGCPGAPFSGAKSGSGNGTDTVVFDWSNGYVSGGTLTNGTFSGTAHWSTGGTSNSGYLYALQFTKRVSEAPDTFLGYAKSNVTTLTQNTATTINLNFIPVTSTATVTGTLAAPVGVSSWQIELYQQFGSTVASLWTTTSTTTVDATFPLLTGVGGNFLYASGSGPDGSSYFMAPLTGDTAVNFTVPAPVTLTAPASAATGVTANTPFSWTGPDLVQEVLISTTGSTKAKFRIYTMAKQITIPVVPEVPIPSGQSFTWGVSSFAPTSSINDAAAANELRHAVGAAYSGAPFASTIGNAHGFTTQ